ncbi:DUF5715 family protein [Algoriphagus sp.]|uniref:DUF5715 family protein n=1 Tax=Algoriphagus sp. TaxID=1872435 RepID=UPI0027260974|nr:DUF5715 family protein [Algoriphagus sp.]MDO8965876.1 DUF5715 family protein [Algoriphagus sp.]MDP3201072.1 DUF5715 family protein [Algoriphagus sp.]
MKKLPLILLASFFVLFSVAALASDEILPAIKRQLKKTYSALTNHSPAPEPQPIFEPIVVEVPIPNPEIVVPTREITKEYDNHLVAGENNGFGLIESEEHFTQLIQEKKLVLVSEGNGYRVDELTHSHPYVTPRSKVILEEIGQAFQSLTKQESFFTVSSVTRTPEQQQNLRKRNRNATAGISSHSYGVSFDISYIRFNGKKGGNRSAQKDLETVLNEFQAANKIFFIKERKQSCYHVTVR